MRQNVYEKWKFKVVSNDRSKFSTSAQRLQGLPKDAQSKMSPQSPKRGLSADRTSERGFLAYFRFLILTEIFESMPVTKRVKPFEHQSLLAQRFSFFTGLIFSLCASINPQILQQNKSRGLFRTSFVLLNFVDTFCFHFRKIVSENL